MDWKSYALSCIKELYPIPDFVVDVVGDRFSSLEQFVMDTNERCGCIASSCLSLLYRPKIIVEMGVKSGQTALLLCKFNPDSFYYGVDIRGRIDDACVPVGYHALINNCHNFSLTIMNSWEFEIPDVDLCFIDADHDEEPVYKDSIRAWKNRNKKGDWCIAWDDYHPSNEGVVKSVDRFCGEVGHELFKIGSWYYIGTKTMEEQDLILTGF